MSIHLSSGLQITVPNSQYMVPFVSIERNGSQIFDDSIREFLFNSIAGDQPATLGRYFLTSAYLMVNHDSGTFTLWQANPSTATKTVAVVSEGTAQDCASVGNGTGIVQPSAAASTTPDSQTTPSGQAQSGPSSGLSTGAIAGIAVVAVGGVALLALAVLYFRRKARAARSPEATAFADGAGGPPMAKHDEFAWQGPYEAPGVHVAHEMEGGRYNPGDRQVYRPVHEMDGGR